MFYTSDKRKTLWNCLWWPRNSKKKYWFARVSRYELWFNNKLGFTRKPWILQDAARKKKENAKRRKKSAKAGTGRKRMWKSAALARVVTSARTGKSRKSRSGPREISNKTTSAQYSAPCRSVARTRPVAQPNNKAITIDSVHVAHYTPGTASIVNCVNAATRRPMR